MSWSQANDRLTRMEETVDSLQRSFTGEEIAITKNLIKTANAKLILAEEYKFQYESYKKLYELKVKDSYLQDSIISKQLAEIRRITTLANYSVSELQKQSSKSARYKKQRNGFIASTTVLAIVVLTLLK